MDEDKKILAFRDQETILFEAGDIVQTLLDFLGTETFEKMFSSIDKSSEKAIFQAGLMLVPSILAAKCNKYYAVPVHENNQEEEYEPKSVPAYEDRQRWIPVTERLPEEKISPMTMDYTEYPCVFDGRAGQREVRYYKFGKGHFWHGSGCIDEYVTHWAEPMPLPESPKGEDHD